MDFDHTVAEVAALVGGRVEGSGERRVTGLRAWDRAGPDELAAVFRELPDGGATCRAGCLLVSETATVAAGDARSVVRVADPEEALDRLAGAWGPRDAAPPAGVHPTALVEEGAEVDATASVGPWVWIGRGARVGPRTGLGPGVFLGEDARVGADCTLHPRVYVGARCRLGDRVVVHPGAVIGADGFGYRQDARGRHLKSPQVGHVDVGDDVEIGANTTIDRARLEATVIGAGTKLDDLVHVAHNCTVGEHCAFAAQVGLAGSAVVGRHVLVGGQAGISDGRRVGDGARVGGGSAVMRDVPPGAVHIGYPAGPSAEWKRQVLSLARLPDLIARQRGSAARGEDRRGA